MTDGELKAKIGDTVSGEIQSQSADEVRRITAVLREMGYTWKLMYTNDGTTCLVRYFVDPQ